MSVRSWVWIPLGDGLFFSFYPLSHASSTGSLRRCYITNFPYYIHWSLAVLPEAKEAQISPSEVKKHPVMNQLKNKIDGSSKIILNHHRSQFFATLSFQNFFNRFFRETASHRCDENVRCISLIWFSQVFRIFSLALARWLSCWSIYKMVHHNSPPWKAILPYQWRDISGMLPVHHDLSKKNSCFGWQKGTMQILGTFATFHSTCPAWHVFMRNQLYSVFSMDLLTTR